MNTYQPGLPTIEFMSSLAKFDGIAQSVDIKISTFIFKAAPEPVLAVYDFVMTTFVPGPDQQQQQAGTRLIAHQYAY